MSFPPMDDQQLISRYKKGDQQAFVELYERYVDHLYRFVTVKISDSEDARDITQSVFLDAIQGLRRVTIRTSFKTWLFSIAANKVKAYWIKHYEMPVDSIDQLLESTDIEDDRGLQGEERQTEDDEQGLLQRLKAYLSEEQLQVLYLRFYRNSSRREVADALRIPEETVKTRQYQALKKLRGLNVRSFSFLTGGAR